MAPLPFPYHTTFRTCGDAFPIEGVLVATYLSHARTVVRECCKGDDESQWERVKFDPPPPKNPLTDGHHNLGT